MNTLDIILLVPVGIGVVVGVYRGLVKELSSLAAIFLAIMVAKIFSPIVSQLLIEFLHFSSTLASLFAYLILFVGTILIMRMFSTILEKVFEKLALGGLNKLLGGVFGGLKIALLISVLLNLNVLLNKYIPLLKKDSIEQSIVYKPMLSIVPELWDESKKLQHEK